MKIGAKQLRRLVREAMTEMGEELPEYEPGSREEAGERLEAIHDTIADLNVEALALVRQWGTPAEGAKAADWYGRIMMALGRGHGVPVRGTTLEDTANLFLYGDERSPAYRASERVPGGYLPGDED